MKSGNVRKELAEVFIDALNEDYSDESVGAALKKCDHILKKELENLHTEEEYVAHFFELENGQSGIKECGLELIAFWDVFKEFQEILKRMDFGSELIILKTIAEVDYLYKCVENQNTRETVSDTYANTINEVVQFIDNLEDKKQLTITILGMQGSQYEKVVPMDSLIKESKEYNRVFLEILVMDLVNKFGVIEIEFHDSDKVYITFREEDWRILKKIEK